MRVPLIVLALVAAPLTIGAAQGQSGGNANANADNRCKNTPQAGVNGDSQRGGTQAAQAQLNKNCPAPPPPAGDTPPTGVNRAMGMVYEDIDGSGRRDPFAGEMGLAGWTVQLVWNGQVVATATTAWDGTFTFLGLGNATYSVCVIGQGGYSQTSPVGSNGCGGAGYSFTFNNTFETWAMNNDFGMMLQ
jgi:hypothetical protein